LPIELSGGDTVLNRKVFGIRAWQNSCQYQLSNDPFSLPDIPVLPETLLMMEVSALGSAIDLRQMTEVVLSDLGATIQIMRRVGAEGCFGEEQFNRVEDCISMLGVQACIQAVSRQTVTRAMNKSVIRESWSHARTIAERCKRLAEDTDGNMNPDAAYLTGLLHELGSLPVILEWEPQLTKSDDPTATGFRLAGEWSLPSCVVEYFDELQYAKTVSRRTEIVQRAHELSSFSRINCLSDYPLESRVVAFDRR
jgi:hypothetical protein